ncbi:MAG: glycoside hydrolase family 88 protein [Chitinophagales bacterium]
MKYLLLCLTMIFSSSTFAQTWVDTLDNFVRKSYMPPQNYGWTWQNAPLLHVMEIQYEMMPEEEKAKYLLYVKRAVDKNIVWVSGAFPNAVASSNGLAFLYRATGNELYGDLARNVYYEYLNIRRTSNGGVSHLAWTPELWDDTVYMIGVYLLAMYRATNDEKYLDEIIEQFKAHKEKLVDEASGLWVHGWDGDDKNDFDFCSQINWPDPITRRSSELWGRGNGWVVVTLSELLNNMDPSHPEWDYIANSLKEMIEDLPSVQDEATGHWYQLPYRNEEEGNYIESSCTAMFGYGILTALKHEIVAGEVYENAVKIAYHGLRAHSTFPVIRNDIEYYNVKNVAQETCIGDKDYYFNITSGQGKVYAIAMFVLFGRTYEAYINPPVVISNLNHEYLSSFKIYPTVLKNSQVLQLSINANRA